MPLRGVQPDRRSVARGLAAAAAAAALALRGGPSAAQIASIEVVAATGPGDGDDQLARAIAEGLTSTHLLPSAGAADAPGEDGVTGFKQFVSGARPKPGLMVLGLGTLGSLVLRKADEGIDGTLPLATMIGERQPIIVAAESPIQTLQDLLAAIRRDQASVRWGGRALGGADHQISLLTTQAAGGDLRRVNYLAGDHRTEVVRMLLEGEISVATGDLIDLLAQIRGGTIRALALASDQRAPDVDVPTFREQGVDIALLHWRGAIARKSMDPALAVRFSDALEQLSQATGWRQLLSQRSWQDLYAPGPEFAALLDRERARMSTLFSSAGLL